MTPILNELGKQLVGKTVHFKCDCIFPLDFKGEVVASDVVDDVIKWLVRPEGTNKLIPIESNHPNMMIEIEKG